MDILILFIFLLIYFICAATVLLIYYYYRILFPGKDKYDRDELINIRYILNIEFKNLFPSNERAPEFLVLTLGSIIGFIFTYIGGIYGENYESYLFHSAILPVLLYFGLGYLKKEKLEKELPSPIQNLFKHDFSFFIGFTLSTLAKTILVYGFYHVVSFIWVLPNIIAMVASLVVRIVEKHKKDDYNLFFKRKTSDN
ncbi:MAG: hypothetical protein OEV78_06750 [Spirochaetia bacterium]|nr:hypothetical protein [Spirochaetia bacterium]